MAFALVAVLPVFESEQETVRMNGIFGAFLRLLPAALLRYAARLRFPNLFLLVLVCFVADLLLPDFIPFLDEILLGLCTLMLAAWKNKRGGGGGGEF